jgi:two-component sensor histidine kinase
MHQSVRPRLPCTSPPDELCFVPKLHPGWNLRLHWGVLSLMARSERGYMSEDRQVEWLRKQAIALSHFGMHALQTHDLDGLLQEACRLVSKATGVELVKILELLPGGDSLLVRAGVNWKPGVVGSSTLGAHTDSPAGYALQEDEPVISSDTAKEDRFAIPQVIVEHHVKSMVNVVMRGERGAWGVLEMDAREHRDFTVDDISFLQNYANVLTAAIERLQTEAELKDAAERRSILLGELQHRVRNMLLNVRTLARRTAKMSANLDQFVEAFDARLLALARTQELLTQGSGVRARLEETLRQELKAHGADHGSRVLFAGPDVRLGPKEAQALGMAFHELATNASKYGALSQDGAQLKVSWRTVSGETSDDLEITWRETGVPLEAPPARRGFGSETIERSLPYMLGGKARIDYHPQGVECTIRFPLGKDGTSDPVRD